MDPQGLEQVDLPRLGRAVCLRSRQPAVAGDGGDTGNDTGALRQHLREHRRDRVAHADQVDLDVLVEGLGVPVLGAHLLPVAGGQDRDVDWSELVLDASCSGLQRRGVGDVSGDREHGVSRGP